MIPLVHQAPQMQNADQSNKEECASLTIVKTAKDFTSRVYDQKSQSRWTSC